MSTFTDRIFSFKGAYEFEEIPDISLEDFLSNELIFQLQDLEDKWVNFDLKNWNSQRNIGQEIDFQCFLEKIRFRLHEILRFLSQYKGPRIIQFVCSEILDFLKESEIANKNIEETELKQVEHLLVVMNSFFQPEITQLGLSTQSEIADRLKNATEGFLNRFSGKNREESLVTLSNLKLKGKA